MAVVADTRCLLCQLERNIAAARKLGTEEQAAAYARDLMKYLADTPAGVPARVTDPVWAAGSSRRLCPLGLAIHI